VCDKCSEIILVFEKYKAKKEYGMKENKILLHYLSQLVPVLDIIDILYLSNKYRKRGRLLSIITAACVFIFVVIAIVAYIIRV